MLAYKDSFTCTKTGCLLPSSAPKQASIPNMAPLELISSGRSPEKDMMSAEHTFVGILLQCILSEILACAKTLESARAGQ